MKKIALVLLAMGLSASVAQAQIVSSKNSRITVTKQKTVHNYEGYNRFSFGLATDKLRSSDDKIFNFKAMDFDDKSVTLKGVDINYLRGISLTQKVPLYLEVGGRLTFDTYKYTDEDSDSGSSYGNTWSEKSEFSQRLNLLSLSVPVNITYKYTFNNGLYIAPFVGIHFRLNLLAQDKWEYEESYTYNGRTESESNDGTVSFFKADDDDDDAYFDDNEDTAKRFQFGGQVGVNFGYKALNLGLAYYFDSPIYKYDESVDFKVKTGGVSFTLGVNF